MSYRPFRKFSRFTLAACAVSLGTASLVAQSTGDTQSSGGTQSTSSGTQGNSNGAQSSSAQTAATPALASPGTPAAAYYNGPNPSRADLFLGYSYFGAHGQVNPAGIRYSSVDEGAVISGAYYFNKYFGGEIEGFANPDGHNDGLYSGSAGPIFRAPLQNFTLFAHALAGGVRLGGPNNDTPGQFEHEPYTWGVGITAGGGMDYNLPFFNGAFGIRVFEADYRYIHTDFGPATTVPTGGPLGGRTNMSAVELSAGILMHVGHIIPPPPIVYACALTTPAAGATIYPGDPVEITGTATNVNPKKPVTYSWTSDAGPIGSTSNVASVSTASLNPGTFTVKGHVMQGAKPGQFADCTVPFTLTQVQPPTITCSANPATVNPAQSSTITSQGSSPQNRPLTYSYSATSGSISGNTATATLDTTGVAPGTVTVTCNVVDDKGQTASTTTSVTVSSPVIAVIPVVQQCSISFDRDAKRPTRVNNEAKACLDDIALAMQRDPQARLDVVGNASSDESGAQHRAAERAVNEKAYLVSERGIDASRISVFTGTGTGAGKTVTNTLVPAGSTDATTGVVVDEATIVPVPRNSGGGGHRGRGGRHGHGARRHHRHSTAGTSNQ